MVKGMAGKVITKNAPYTCKYNILFKIVGKVSKYEKNNTIHNGCWPWNTRVHNQSTTVTYQKPILFKGNA